MPFFAASEAPPRPESMKFPVFSLLAGNLAFSETSSQLTPPLTLRAVFRLALRQTEGLIASLLRLLGLDLAAPDHSTMSRRGATLPVAQPPGSGPVHLLVDGTGLKLWSPGEWLVEEHASR